MGEVQGQQKALSPANLYYLKASREFLNIAMAANPLAWEQSGNNKEFFLFLCAPNVPCAII